MHPPRGLVTVVDTPELAIICEGVLFVAHFRGTLTLATLEALEEAHARRRKVAPGGVAMMSFLDGAPLPGDDMRLASARSFRRIAEANACSATVVSGVGFWASAARSTLTALTLLARPACPAKVFRDGESALAWMESVVPGAIGRFRPRAAELDRWKSRLPS